MKKFPHGEDVVPRHAVTPASPVPLERIRERARELARRDGRTPERVTQRDFEAAKRELSAAHEKRSLAD